MARTTKRPRGPQGKRGLTGKTGPRGRRGKSGPSGPVHITRTEFETALKDIGESLRTLQIQFQRMADMQAEVDVLKRVVERLSNKLNSLTGVGTT